MDSNPEANLLPFILEEDKTGVYKVAPDEAELALTMHLLKSRLHKKHALTKLFWPIYLVKSSSNKYMLIDGFGLSEHEVNYYVIPAYTEFQTEIMQMEPAKHSKKAFIKKLRQYKKLTQKASYIVDRKLPGCISDEVILQEYTDYLKTVTRQNVFIGPMMLTPRLSLDDSLSALDAANQVKRQTKDDIETLNTVLNSVKKVKYLWIEYLTQSQAALSEKISHEVEEIRKQTEIRISEYETLGEKEKIAQEEKSSMHLAALQTMSTQKAVSTKEGKNTNSHTKKMSSDIKNEINAAIKDRDKQIRRIQQHYTNLIEQEKKKITSREEKKNKQLLKIDKEAGELDKLAFELEQLLIKALENKQNDLTIFNRLHIELPRHLNSEAEAEVVQLYMPFYMVKSPSKKHGYILYPKTIYQRAGIFSKLIGLILRCPVKIQPTLPMFERKTHRNFDRMLKKDKRYEGELEEKSIQNDIMKKNNLRTIIRTGAQYIKEKRWLSNRSRRKLM
ncbi:MAG: hypothetical protein NTV30_01295 [Chloroflexi bacterium]|nr:hypothetical protein [Chloroflexota bacterium]